MKMGTLTKMIKTLGSLSEAVAAEITYQVLQSLSHLKKHKIIHRGSFVCSFVRLFVYLFTYYNYIINYIKRILIFPFPIF